MVIFSKPLIEKNTIKNPKTLKLITNMSASPTFPIANMLHVDDGVYCGYMTKIKYPPSFPAKSQTHIANNYLPVLDSR